MKRELKSEEHEEIVRAVAAGDRVKATNLYLSATEGNLTDAQNFIKTLTTEAEGVCPVYCGENGRQNALDYAQQRAHSGRCDIQVLDEKWNVVETITNEDLKPVA